MPSHIYLAGPPYAEEYRRRATVLLREAGLEPLDPMRRDFRGATEGRETEIVDGDLADIRDCDAVLAAFTEADEGTAMEAWYAHSLGKPVVAYTGGSPVHPWTVYVSVEVHADLEDAVRALMHPAVSSVAYPASGSAFVARTQGAPIVVLSGLSEDAATGGETPPGSG